MKSTPYKVTRIPSLKSIEMFLDHLKSLNVELPCDSEIITGSDSPIGKPYSKAEIAGKTVGNRVVIHPMEGWDGTTEGGVTELMQRRWSRFGVSGAKLIWGGEAMAVRPDGRANPNQLILNESNVKAIAGLREILVHSHQEKYGETDDLVIGFQLTHSGRFCRPYDKKRLEPRIAYRHPILDRKFGIDSDDPILSDAEIKQLIESYTSAAVLAEKAGADFIDIKHCHGYLLHEFLSARHRPGPYGGSFENRTRILRELVEAIRSAGVKLAIGVRLSAFDFVPFRPNPDPELAEPGKLGPGTPEEFEDLLPYDCVFGSDPNNPLSPALDETRKFIALCGELGIQLINLTAGSPYYNPHIQRPAAYPPSDGYQPAHDPLIDVARQMNVVRELMRSKPDNVALVGSGYSYLQEFLPQVAQAAIRDGWCDFVGLGRVVLSYPTILMDAIEHGKLTPKLICRTFSDCTSGPRNGMISGCFPLDPYYSAMEENQKLKALKKNLKSS